MDEEWMHDFFDFPIFRVSAKSEVRKSGFSDFPDLRKSDVRKPAFPEIRKSGFSDFRTSRSPCQSLGILCSGLVRALEYCEAADQITIRACLGQKRPEQESRLSPCLLREIPHRQILHPMPFYLIFGCSDFPKIRQIGKIENPDFRVFRKFGISISEAPDFRKSENPDFQISGLPDFSKTRISGNPKIRVFRFPGHQM